MIDGLVILTPILLLAVVALLGFVGCDTVFNIHSTGLVPPNQEVGYVNTAVFVEPANADTVTAVLSGLSGGELIVITLQWNGPAPTRPPNLTPAAGPYNWELQTSAQPKKISAIQVFTAINPAHAAQFTVTLQVNSTVPWSVCLSAFNTVNMNTPTANPQTQVATTHMSSLQTAVIGLSAGDALYAFGLVADGKGNFPSGANNLANGPGFTLDDAGLAPPNSGDPAPLVEHLTTDNYGSNQSLPAVIVNNTENPNLFVFGMAIRAAPSD